MLLTEALYRLAAMVNDEGETWDLSPNDKEAISVVLEALKEKTLEVAKCRSVKA